MKSNDGIAKGEDSFVEQYPTFGAPHLLTNVSHRLTAVAIQ